MTRGLAGADLAAAWLPEHVAVPLLAQLRQPNLGVHREQLGMRWPAGGLLGRCEQHPAAS